MRTLIKEPLTCSIFAQILRVIVHPELASANATQPIPKNIIPNYYLTDFELSPDDFVEKNLAGDDNAKLDTYSTGLDHYLAVAETNNRLSTESPTRVQESGDNDEKYVCAICQTSFENQTSVAEHIENTHMNENKVDNLNCEESVQRDADNKKNQICPICRKAFTFKAWLDRHMGKEHAGQKYTCKHCTKTFPKLSKLNEHAKCHSTERLFTCGVCDARFKRQKELTAHARKHSDVRPYSCSQCGMRFKTKSTLQGHSLLHEQKKPHLCSVCGWRFAQVGNLRAHLLTHSACSSPRRRRRRAAPPCPHCARQLADHTSLMRHIRTHTGELPYKCPYCARAFIDSWKRKVHLMRQHRLALADIPAMARDPPRDTLSE
ncbi:hypothetical protein JYU34_010704 [Plutella xylostella]|uniref:C2H2-type domain-containing protein n=1 Tax=Plutella xylostella TaxID=51655 RepID=A0ABQ7QF13_PLUXY|nr:hypothetical protein JYU34_010704 [Plutella xylostella]